MPSPARRKEDEMPVYQDEKTKTWYCKFYYTDYTGERHQKKKRGFKLQREAKEWERNFLEQQQGNPSMIFENFIKVYLDDMRPRLRENTMIQKENIISLKILPYFGKLPLNAITPAHIRKWQNNLIDYRDEEGNPYAPTYIKIIHTQLTAVFNYAVKYYGLKDNPCRKAGSIGKYKSGEMKFWTIDEYKEFAAVITNPRDHAAFQTLYYTGMRIGELLALTLGDIDFNACTISITKSYQRINKQDVVTPPKTPKSIRTVSIPESLRDELKEYSQKIYGIKSCDRIFPHTRRIFDEYIIRYAALAGVKRIRLHDLRHSHASLLIEMGFDPLLIAERLGHENIQTTLNTYSHLYPHKQDQVASKLQNLIVPK